MSELFDTPQWKERIAEGLAELEAGEGVVYLSDSEFLASLDEDGPRINTSPEAGSLPDNQEGGNGGQNTQ